MAAGAWNCRHLIPGLKPGRGWIYEHRVRLGCLCGWLCGKGDRTDCCSNGHQLVTYASERREPMSRVSDGADNPSNAQRGKNSLNTIACNTHGRRVLQAHARIASACSPRQDASPTGLSLDSSAGSESESDASLGSQSCPYPIHFSAIALQCALPLAALNSVLQPNKLHTHNTICPAADDAGVQCTALQAAGVSPRCGQTYCHGTRLVGYFNGGDSCRTLSRGRTVSYIISAVNPGGGLPG